MFERLKWLLPALTLLAAMILLSASSRQPGRGVSPLAGMVLEVAGPVERVLTGSARAVEDFFRHYFYLVDLRRENEELRAIVARQGQQVVQLGEYKAAGERLTALLGFRDAYPHLSMKPAYVLAWEPGPWFRTVIISVGSDDGVRPEQAVVHDTGVVGRVVEVSPNYARVLLATDFNSSIDAFIQRTRAVGILGGEGSGPMSLKYVRKDEDVRLGDQVVTSGLDGFFPRGLPLGLVSRVNRQSADMFAAVEVTPAVAFDRLEEVMVLVYQSPPLDWLSLAPRLRPLVPDGADGPSRRPDNGG